jgi:signal transduction histidine kinase
MERTWRWCRRHPDAIVAVVLATSSTLILWFAGPGRELDSLGPSLAMIGAAGAVAWRRRYPASVAIVTGILISVPAFTASGSAIFNTALFLPLLIAAFLDAYALGSDCRSWQRSLPALLILVAGINAPGGPVNPFPEMLTIGPWLAGLVVASRRRTVAALELRTRELEEERGLFAVQSVQYERARIARELHDIVAHCVSLIVVQANAGEQLTHQDPESAAEAFVSISAAARQAETEIDRLVRLLDTSAPTAAPAGLRIVEELVQRARASGLHISAAFSADSDRLSEQSAEAAYRLVQESVTNAMKHAPGAPIAIAIRGHDDVIEVEVRNDTAAQAFSGLEDTGGGHGLGGMRERVSRCGGTFDAGPTADHGWKVSARIPRFADGSDSAKTVAQQAVR